MKDDEAKKAIAAGYAEAVKEPESKAKKAEIRAAKKEKRGSVVTEEKGNE